MNRHQLLVLQSAHSKEEHLAVVILAAYKEVALLSLP